MKVIFDLPDGMTEADIPALKAAIQDWAKTVMKAKSKNRGMKFKGIGRHAQMLGVRREHLWLVLTGQRTSHSLLSRYSQIKKEHAS